MLRHNDHLDQDIQNATDKNDQNLVKYYEGAKSATSLYINLLEDVLKGDNTHV